MITVSFDDADEASLAFVPAAMSSEPIAAVAGTAGAAGGTSLTVPFAIAAMLPGDSSSRPTSFQGIQRFAPSASVDRVDATNPPLTASAVGLPEDSTTAQTASTADTAIPIDWVKLSYADPHEFLRQIQELIKQLRTEMIHRIQTGESNGSIWQWLQDTLDRIQGDNPISRIFYDEGWWDDITIFRSYPGIDVSALTFEIRDTQFDWELLTSIPNALERGYIDRWGALNRLQLPPSRPLIQLRP